VGTRRISLLKRTEVKMEKGSYIYCIIGANGGKKFTPLDGKYLTRFTLPGIGGGSDQIYSISYRDIAAVISASPVMRYPISRENTIAHQKVLEELMEEFTVLPVKFGTVASSKDGVCAADRIRGEVLKVRYGEFKELLVKMDNKIELGLKAIWTDMKTIFQEIVDENREIRKLRQKLFSKPVTQPFGEKATLGEMVIHALERKKSKEERDILNVLKDNYIDKRINKVFGDKMITNLAFLVERSKVEEFDRLVDKLDTTYDGRIKFKYVGPVPPINFVELVIFLKE